MNKNVLLFTGSSHPQLAQAICTELQISLGAMTLTSFPDKEICVQILEEVQGKDVFVLQSLALDPHLYLMELLILIDALRRSRAKSITAIIPYLSYCRQDRRNKDGMPITAKLVANLLSTAGVDHLITFDLHCDQIEGFFEIPVTHLRCGQIFLDPARKLLGEKSIVVAPDIGSIKIAESMAKLLQVDMAVLQKKRHNAFDVEMILIGNVSSKNILLVDDLCSTAGTLVAAASLCKKMGAHKIIAEVSHGLFVGNALEKIEQSPIDDLLITDTIPNAKNACSKIQIVSIASSIAQTIKKIIFL